MVNACNTYLQVQQGNRDELVLKHAPLVKRLAYHLISRLPANVEVDDLIQAGMIGLMEAASHYRSDKGASFETFAGIRIRGAMLDEVRREGWAPRSVTRRIRELGQAMHRVENRFGREAQPAEVAREMGISLDDYHDILNDAGSHRLFSLDQILEESHEPVELGDDGRSNPLGALMAAGFEGDLASQIDKLPEREKMVLALYYEQGLNLKEIGLVLEVSESRVCQIHSQAVMRLRTRMTSWLDAGDDD